MNEKTAEILVQGLKDCFVRSPDNSLGGIHDTNNVADALGLIAYALRVMYINFGGDQMSLKEASDLKLEASMVSISSSLSEIAGALDDDVSNAIVKIAQSVKDHK